MHNMRKLEPPRIINGIGGSITVTRVGNVKGIRGDVLYDSRAMVNVISQSKIVDSQEQSLKYLGKPIDAFVISNKNSNDRLVFKKSTVYMSGISVLQTTRPYQ